MRLALALLLLSLASGSCSRAIDTTIQDAAITAGVKTALLNDAAVDGTTVEVRTVGGVVRLEGMARTRDEADRMIALVRGVGGVRDVDARISVEPRSTPRF
ncbi:MAG: BON domain-containing protein [Vicinamibacterales bacterium]